MYNQHFRFLGPYLHEQMFISDLLVIFWLVKCIFLLTEFFSDIFIFSYLSKLTRKDLFWSFRIGEFTRWGTSSWFTCILMPSKETVGTKQKKSPTRNSLKRGNKFIQKQSTKIMKNSYINKKKEKNAVLWRMKMFLSNQKVTNMPEIDIVSM